MPGIVLNALNVIMSYSRNNPRDIHYYFSDFVSKEIEAQRCELRVMYQEMEE